MKKSRPGRSEVEFDYIRGVNIPDLMKKYDIPRGTINGWHLKYEWARKREEFSTKLSETLFDRLSNGLVKAAEIYIENAIIIGELANAGLKQQKKKEGKTSQADREVIKDWTRISKDGSSIIKNAAPDANEQQMDRMIKEIQELRRGQSSQNKATFSGN